MSAPGTPQGNSGQAFPTPLDGLPYVPGMTLRDWFAGQALAGLSALESYVMHDYALVALHAYTQADAMLVERATTNVPATPREGAQ